MTEHQQCPDTLRRVDLWQVAYAAQLGYPSLSAPSCRLAQCSPPSDHRVTTERPPSDRRFEAPTTSAALGGLHAWFSGHGWHASASLASPMPRLHTLVRSDDGYKETAPGSKSPFATQLRHINISSSTAIKISITCSTAQSIFLAMAPSATLEPAADPSAAAASEKAASVLAAKLAVRQKNADGSPLYPEFMPFYDPLEKVDDLGSFEHDDPGHRADPALPNLLKHASKVTDLSPHVGTEIEGVQLSQLSAAGLDELALLAARRGALVFRGQDFCNIGFEAQKRLARHFGPLHVHGWAPHPAAGSPEHMVIYDSGDDLRVRRSWRGRSPVQWHTDQSPEPQPPGTSFICMLESPAAAGGDTLVSSSVAAYAALSPRFRRRLDGLTAVHANNDGVTQELQNNGSAAVMRRRQLVQEHPVVLVHPVTGQKALYVNPVYTKRIVGFDQEESDALLHFLFDHIAKRQDLQCRVRYEAGTVLVWDQRVTHHSQTLDYPAGERRHAFRLTPLANKPIPARIEEDDGECARDPGRVQLDLC